MEQFQAADDEFEFRPQKGLNSSDLVEENTDSDSYEDGDDSCEELDDADGSLASSYDAEVAMHFECEGIDQADRQEHHMKKLNKFHKDAIKLMTKKSTAKFG